MPPSTPPPTDQSPEQRLAINEAVHRQVNEAIDRHSGTGTRAVRCECSRLGCTGYVRLSDAEYRAVRSDFDRFLLLREHLAPIDEVVEDHDRYVVAVKTGAGGDVARRTDPRADRRAPGARS